MPPAKDMHLNMATDADTDDTQLSQTDPYVASVLGAANSQPAVVKAKVPAGENCAVSRRAQLIQGKSQ
jgi:hypothetical protein